MSGLLGTGLLGIMPLSNSVPESPSDNEAPVITLTGPSVINLEVGDVYTEQGATWSDNVDGSGNASVGGDIVNTSVEGTYTVTYNYTDAAGNAATQVTRTVTVSAVVVPDLTPPVITLTGPSVINLETGQTYSEQGATWTDNVDGSGAAVVSGDTVDVNTEGTYVVRYNYTDAAGNAAVEVTRTVIVTLAVVPDTEAPVITLVGPSTVNLKFGEVYNEQGATWTDNVDGSGDASISGDIVNVAADGTYTVRYNYTDNAGNAAVEVTRTVIVAPYVIPPLPSGGSSNNKSLAVTLGLSI